jgi:uncharacterized membrane protein YkvA (DUF1232 family)
MTLLQRLRQRAHRLNAEVYALSFACHDPRVSWLAKALTICVVAYALSPIDLIPDFIPVLGLADDLLLLPLGIALVIRLIPPIVLAESRERARLLLAQDRPTMRGAAIVIVGIWIILALLLVAWLSSVFAR